MRYTVINNPTIAAITLKDVAITDKLTTAVGEEDLPIYSDKEYTTEVTSVAVIEVGQTVTLYAKYTVTQADVDAQVQISNIATAGTTPSEPEIIVPEKENKKVEVITS